jgi:hypothetical protein
MIAVMLVGVSAIPAVPPIDRLWIIVLILAGVRSLGWPGVRWTLLWSPIWCAIGRTSGIHHRPDRGF